MHVTSVSATASEVRTTLEVTFEMVNDLVANTLDSRSALAATGFSRAADASGASVERLDHRLAQLLPLLQSLPDLDDEQAIARINEELTELPIAPSIVSHDGVPAHLHWTPSTATFDTQVLADILMAFAQELCDAGTIRFGRCGAEDCERQYYDGTRNRSRRFCSDPRCASRTHTADHRARQRDS